MIDPMIKVEVVGPTTQLSDAIDHLQEMGCLHVIDRPLSAEEGVEIQRMVLSETESQDRRELDELLTQIRMVLPHLSAKAKRRLEEILDEPVRSMSYPYGLTNVRLKRLVARAGFNIACSVSSGPLHFEQDLLEIRRVVVRATTDQRSLIVNLSGSYGMYRWLVWRIKTLARAG